MPVAFVTHQPVYSVKIPSWDHSPQMRRMSHNSSRLGVYPAQRHICKEQTKRKQLPGTIQQTSHCQYQRKIQRKMLLILFCAAPTTWLIIPWMLDETKLISQS